MTSPLFSPQGLASALLFGGIIYQEVKHRKSSGLAGTMARTGSPESVEKVLTDIKNRVRTTNRRVTRRGVVTADDRVHYVIKMIRAYRTDPDIRRLAAAIVTQKCGKKWCIKEKDWVGEVKATFKFVRENTRYTRDPDQVDTYQSPLVSLESQAIDCDCGTILLGSLLGSIGYPMQARIIELNGAGVYGHIYLMVGMPPTRPQGWVPLDASVDEKPGFQAPGYMVARHKDFRI